MPMHSLISTVTFCAAVPSVQANTMMLFVEAPSVPVKEQVVQDVVMLWELTAVTVRLAARKKLPAVYVAEVQSLTTSDVTTSAVPVHSRIAKRKVRVVEPFALNLNRKDSERCSLLSRLGIICSIPNRWAATWF